MDLGLLGQLGRGVYYSPTPALAVDGARRVVDFNLALEALAPHDLNGRRGESLDLLLSRLARYVTRGDLVPTAPAHDGSARCEFDAPGIGSLRLTARGVDCIDPATGTPLGRIISWSIDAAGSDAFHVRFRALLDHELTWDTYARSYDRVLCLMPYYEEVVSRHLAALSEAGEGPVIDLGAGTGNLVERLIAAGRHVTAVDSSRAMLEKLFSKVSLADQIGQRLRVIEASIAVLPMLDDGSYSGASILLTLFDMDDPEPALATAVRLVRPGGVVVVTELKKDFQLAPILAECESRLKQLGRYEELRGDLHRVVHSNETLAPGSRSPFRAEDVYRSLEQWGFTELSWADSHFRQCATVRGRKPLSAGPSRAGEANRR